MPALRIHMQPYPQRPGSICCLARDPADPRSLFILSAGHVVAPLDISDVAAVRGQRIPILCEFPGVGTRAVGTLLDWLPLDYDGLNRFDAGQVLVNPDAAQALLDAVPLPVGVTDLAEENWDICTLGAKTQELRRGKIQERRVEGLSYRPNGCIRDARFDPDNHFSVAPVSNTDSVTVGGDSGAPAFDPSGRLVGLLVSGRTTGGSRSYFARAARVLARFGLKPVLHAEHPAGVSALSLWSKLAGAVPAASLAAAPPAPGQAVDVLARTLWGEARGEGRPGIEGVACVIVNRASRGPKHWWGGTIIDVCKRPRQFSCWNLDDPNRVRLIAVTSDDAAFRTCTEVAQSAVGGTLADVTSGATHYHVDTMMPPWARGKVPCTHIGHHLFYNNID